MRANTDHGHPVDSERVAAVRQRLVDPDETARLIGLLGLLADPVRFRILYALDVVDELCVGDIALALGGSEDSISYALRMLRTAGLVATRKQGRMVLYRLAEGFPEPLSRHCLRTLVDTTRRIVRDDSA